MAQILIIDDDPAICASLALLLKQAGHGAIKALDPQVALQIVSKTPPDLIIMDMNYSRETTGAEGLKLLEDIRGHSLSIPVILITAWGSIDLAVRGMRAGAFNFINKPWNNEQLLRSVQTALNLGAQPAQETGSRSRKELDLQYDFDEIIGEDPQLVKLLDTIGRVSPTDASTLILGESGTGKELIARAIHRLGPRKDGPFVAGVARKWQFTGGILITLIGIGLLYFFGIFDSEYQTATLIIALFPVILGSLLILSWGLKQQTPKQK